MHSLEREHNSTNRSRLQYLFHGLLFHTFHRRERQVLVHVGAVLVRGLLHHSAFVRLDLLGPDLDRAALLASPQTYDRARHPSILKHSQDVDVDPLGPAHFHFHLGLVDRGRDHTLGKSHHIESRAFFPYELQFTTKAYSI